MQIFTPNTVIRSTEVNANFDELKTKTDYLSTPDASWVEVGSGGSAPAFASSWVNYDATTFTTCAFRKDAFGFIYLKGLIKSGTIGQEIFTLPVGYRPIKNMHISTISNGAFGGININSGTGVVMAQYGSNIWYSLDGKVFKAEA